MSLIQTEPKKIYIRVDEQALSYSYDFKNKSVATCQTDWRAFPIWTSMSFWSNGMYKNSSGYQLICSPSITLSTADKITITANITAVSDKDTAFWLYRSYTSGSVSSSLFWSTSYNNTKLRFFNTDSTTTTLYSGATLTNGNHTITITLDLWSKTVSFSDGDNTWSYTLTDDQVTDIRNNVWLDCAVAKTNNYFADISITVI